MLRDNPELKAAKEAIDLLTQLSGTRTLNTAANLIMSDALYFIATARDPKAFVEELCTHIDTLKTNASALLYFQDIKNIKGKLNQVIAGKFFVPSSVEIFEQHKVQVLKMAEEVRLLLSKMAPELEAARSAIEIVCSRRYENPLSSGLLKCICDFIATAINPKVFAQSLCDHMDMKFISGVCTNYLYELDNEDKLSELILSSKKDGRLDAGFSVETFEKNMESLLKAEADLAKFHAAYNKLNTFSPSESATKQEHEDLTIGKMNLSNKR